MRQEEATHSLQARTDFVQNNDAETQGQKGDLPYTLCMNTERHGPDILQHWPAHALLGASFSRLSNIAIKGDTFGMICVGPPGL